MKKLILGLTALTLVVSGCGLTDSAPVSDEGYWKITFTADVSVYNDGSIPETTGGGPVACFADGYIGSVLYFPFEGGEVVAQESFVTMNNVNCIECTSEIASNAVEIPITLSSVLDITSVDVQEEGSEMVFTYDDFRVWMEKPSVYPVDILYSCPGGTPGVASDYGGYISQIVSPLLTQVWSFAPTYGELNTSTFQAYEFPPTYMADIEFNIIEEYVKTID
ncbi:hypothetical protein HN358_01400 [Candidatus Uhrbacteria bacterium]|jgi:hypothetical protein|nr:hypothetical protein [Candidatus Uhrbacteria bacterium]MBT7717314.1 hypothetical protein [Candidatus Uhrbacteria bacterium]